MIVSYLLPFHIRPIDKRSILVDNVYNNDELPFILSSMYEAHSPDLDVPTHGHLVSLSLSFSLSYLSFSPPRFVSFSVCLLLCLSLFPLALALFLLLLVLLLSFKHRGAELMSLSSHLICACHHNNTSCIMCHMGLASMCRFRVGDRGSWLHVLEAPA